MQTNSIRFFESGLLLVEGGRELKTALAEILQLAAEAANSASSSFYVVDRQEHVLKPAITCGLLPSYVDACGDVPIGGQCCGRAVQYRKPWIVSDMLTDPLFASARSAALVSPIRAAFSVPVIDDDHECIGSLACHYAEPHVPELEDIRRNEIWASQMAHLLTQYRRLFQQSAS